MTRELRSIRLSRLSFVLLKLLLTCIIPLVALTLLLVGFRLAGAIIWGVAILLSLIRRSTIGWCRSAVLAALWALFFFITLSPYDISFVNYPGPPRFVRYISGLPTMEGFLSVQSHQAMLGGCLRRRNEPKWVWVW